MPSPLWHWWKTEYEEEYRFEHYRDVNGGGKVKVEVFNVVRNNAFVCEYYYVPRFDPYRRYEGYTGAGN